MQIDSPIYYWKYNGSMGGRIVIGNQPEWGLIITQKEIEGIHNYILTNLLSLDQLIKGLLGLYD